MQKTIAKSIHMNGIGVHSGEEINVTINPADENNGIVFYVEGESIKACCENLVNSPLCTTLKNSNGAKVHTVEHFLATVKSLKITNLNVYIDANEFPIFDGSALEIVKAFSQVSIVDQSEIEKVFIIEEPVYIEHNGKKAGFEPVDSDEFIIDLTCDFSNQGLGVSRFVYTESTENFIEQIAMCRTFGFWEEAEAIKKNGLAKGASLDNTVVFKAGNPVNEGGLRVEKEFIKHKVLDAIGDTSLCSGRIIGKFISYCPGHSLTAELMKKTFLRK